MSWPHDHNLIWVDKKYRNSERRNYLKDTQKVERSGKRTDLALVPRWHRRQNLRTKDNDKTEPSMNESTDCWACGTDVANSLTPNKGQACAAFYILQTLESPQSNISLIKKSLEIKQINSRLSQSTEVGWFDALWLLRRRGDIWARGVSLRPKPVVWFLLSKP